MGWLKYFLAPMQGGTFLENGREHPLGGAIFVFAGGTRPSLAAFTAPMGDKATTKERLDFVEVKGPDFVSRLRGHVDIMGSNPVSAEDEAYPVRRAFLLRSMIQRNYPQLLAGKFARIDSGVLDALLSVRAFNHGARSIEAILAMSALSGATSFNRASLPPIEQLALHVDAEDFMSRVAGEHLDPRLQERIGRRLHEVYREERRRMVAGRPAEEEKLKTDNAMAPWKDLANVYRASSRLQADDIPRKLRFIGCFMAVKNTNRTAVTTFTDAEVERLAELEHERFNVERLRIEWRKGPRDLTARTSPFLIPWRDLEPKWQDVDRNLVRKIPDVLTAVGWRVYRV
jgi:hypothetical protein